MTPPYRTMYEFIAPARRSSSYLKPSPCSSPPPWRDADAACGRSNALCQAAHACADGWNARVEQSGAHQGGATYLACWALHKHKHDVATAAVATREVRRSYARGQVCARCNFLGHRCAACAIWSAAHAQFCERACCVQMLPWRSSVPADTWQHRRRCDKSCCLVRRCAGFTRATPLQAARVAAEGLVGVASSANAAVLVELNCETDFVARNPKFQASAAPL